MSLSNCDNCKFWDHDGHFGSCKRYPKIVPKHANDWCGEFKDKQPKTITLQILNTESLDNPPKNDKVLETKKRGRPKNDK